MDTIDTDVLIDVATKVSDLAEQLGLRYISRVVIELNDNDGADVHITGFTGPNVSLYNEVTVTGVVK